METFYTVFTQRTITIPHIQRDYIQSFDTGLISGFIEALIESLDTGKIINLNYLYGLKDETRFTPIDGQQRLTTLWLLHLYIAANANHQQTTVRLEYKTREYAQDFCYELGQVEHLNDLVYSNINSDKKCPSTFIPNQPWFISSWLNDVSVIAMLQTLDVIANKLSGRNDLCSAWDKLTKPDCPICFSFKDTDDLGDDVYIKMNGRGRALSDFENLKSWMDGKLQEITISDDDKIFLKDWRQMMDNEWTELFWTNRNLNDTYPEDIDDEQLRFFYNMLLLYWTKQDSPETILERFRQSKGYELPLYLLDKTNLFTIQFFRWIYSVLNGLVKYEESIKDLEMVENSSCGIYFWDKPQCDKRISLMCQILFEEKIYDTVPFAKLALCSAISSYVIPPNPKTSLFDWMYRMRNLISNVTIDSTNFKKVLLSIDALMDKCNSELIDSVFLNKGIKIEAFSQKQVVEEAYKSKVIQNGQTDLVTDMRNLENHPFFAGRIGFMFDFVGCTIEDDYAFRFKQYSILISTLFDKNGPKQVLMEDNSLYRSLMSFTTPYSFGYDTSWGWCFLNGKSDWKGFISNNESHDEQKHNDSLRLLIEDIINNIPEEKLNNIDTIHKHLLSVIEKEIAKPSIHDWRRFFIRYKGVWNYMGQKCAKFKAENESNEYDIFLMPKSKFSTKSIRGELRAYCLYLDYKDFIAVENGSINNWYIDFYGKDNTCLYFQKNKDEDCLAIDVYFDRGYATENQTEDSYVLNIFVRPTNDQIDDDFSKRNISHFSGIETLYPQLNYNGERHCTKPMSLSAIKELLDKLLKSY